jgi:hypothetical protein
VGTQKPGPPSSGGLENLPFNDGFGIHNYHKNSLSELFDLVLTIILILSSGKDFLAETAYFQSFYSF